MIFDVFTIVWESDAKKLKDGIKDSANQADRLNDELDKVDQHAKKSTESLGGMFKSLAGIAAGFLAAGAAQQSFTQTIADLEAVGRAAESLGADVEDVDAFSRSVVQLGGDAQGARDSLTDMAESIGEGLQDIESQRAKTFGSLGISLRDVNGQAITAVDGMLKLAESVQGLSREEAIFRIKELGITDNRTVDLILKGREELERMLAVQKEQSAVSEEAVENARLYRESLIKLENSTDSVITQMVVGLVPSIISVVDALGDVINWAREHKDVVVGFFGAVAAIVATAYLPAMVSAATATLAATWPILLIVGALTAAAAAFALAYDDIQNFIAGNDSLIGQIFDNFPGLESAVMSLIGAVRDAWAGMSEYLTDLWDAIQPLGDAFGGVYDAWANTIGALLNLVGNAVSKISDSLGIDLADSFTGIGIIIKTTMDGIVAAVKFAVSFITSALDVAADAIAGIGSAVNTVAGWLGLDNEAETAMANAAAGNAAMATANASPLNNITSSAISNSVNNRRETNLQIGELTVTTQATNADGVAAGISDSLRDQLDRLETEFQSGVDR